MKQEISGKSTPDTCARIVDVMVSDVVRRMYVMCGESQKTLA
jgi:hypothetical protein